MARWHPKRCKDCGRDRWQAGHISAQGYCVPCGQLRHLEAYTAMQDRRSAIYRRWWLKTMAKTAADHHLPLGPDGPYRPDDTEDEQS